MKKFLLNMLVVVGLLLCAGPGFGKTIKIGLLCPLTGSWASEGQDMEKIVKLLADELNSKGGLLGSKVEVVVEDDGGDPRTAALAAQRLAAQEIVGVIGTYGSSVTEATQNIFDEAKIIQIANGSTAIRLTEKGLKYFFRTSPRDDEQGRVAADYIMKKGYKRVAILHDNTTYAKGLADETKTLLKKRGANIVFFDALTPGERDYSAILTNLKAKNPDVVFFTGYYPEAGLLLRQKMEMGWNVQFIGGDATNNPDLVKIAGKDAAKGFLFLSPPVPQDLDTKEAKDFLTAYKKKYGDLPGSVWAVLSGDGFLALTTAIKATKSTDPDTLADYLHNKLKDMPGLTGKIAFDSKGDRVGALYRIYKVDAQGNFILQ
ncbi:branched-chain amino acid ABC transporter substrate-binding protein [Desulfonauticus submarinus]|uniref:Amino acid/amide ABC transporter substrate-binding protein, HAAT family (TC 3.A.1.4.-) n=1 Tax=Desulfonauticus submarinus TaxID=206665 RepID=A0A1H0EN02_9BACT|nr:branched-chain amino acid ABC transporter substrate-binding protein [Desulfonauticus submarinus]SDN83699.1 amino acid/amide ABC transporter substrate-binding protein, HAAT family (TC 3.A.1.4.-) [Desulfonauticus submarinus]